MPPSKAKQAKPSDLKDKFPEVCRLIALGHGLREIGRLEGFPAKSTVLEWVLNDKDLADQYARAREAQAEHFAEEILEICDDGTNDWLERQIAEGVTQVVANTEHIQRSKLRVDARKWLMSKMAPKKYGDKVATELTGKDGTPLFQNGLTDEERSAELAEFLVTHGKKKA